MSIKIDKSKCTGCRKCVRSCPGSLISIDASGKAQIDYPKDCWGCTSCLKECRFGAISYYLGADIGGNGAVMTTEASNEAIEWRITRKDGETRVITIDTKESNKY